MEKQTESAEQLQHNGNFTEAKALDDSLNRDLVSAVYQFCYKANLTVLKSCMMLYRSLIMFLCFDRDL